MTAADSALDRSAALLGLAAAGMLYVAHAWRYVVYINDDAFITFRYSRFLAMGLGPFYNVGEHVEGYTNFLLMLLVAPVIAVLGEGAALPFAKGVGVVSGLLALLLAARIPAACAEGSGPGASPWAVPAVALAVALSPALRAPLVPPRAPCRSWRPFRKGNASAGRASGKQGDEKQPPNEYPVTLRTGGGVPNTMIR